MSAAHVPASCDYLHDPDTDVSAVYELTEAQRQVAELLDLTVGGGRMQRLTRADKRRVDAVVTWGGRE